MNNHQLIQHLVETQKQKKYKKGYVYKRYLELAEFYCKRDLKLIAKLVHYKDEWVVHTLLELKKSPKWVDFKKYTKEQLRKNRNPYVQKEVDAFNERIDKLRKSKSPRKNKYYKDVT